MVRDRDARIRVLLVDDHRLLTDALTHELEQYPDIEVAGVRRTVAEVRSASTIPVDVALMDYRLPDGSGADATRILKARRPSVHVVMVTAITDDTALLDSIQAGADGYLTKDHAVSEIVDAIRSAYRGETLLSAAVIATIALRVAEARHQADRAEQVDRLTPRELEVLRALTEGLSSAQICERLHVSRNTVRTHTQNITSKLHVHSKLEAVAFAMRHRLVAATPAEGDRPSRTAGVGRDQADWRR